MTEQFAFQKIQRNRRAIELYECASIALTCIVSGVGNELFSGTGFPFDEDSRVCGSNLLHLSEDRFESSATTDDPLERSLDLIRRYSVRHCCMISHSNLYDTSAHCLNTHPSGPMSSNKNNGNVAFLFFQLGLQLQTRHPWHADVNDQARGFAMQIGFEELLRGSEAPCRKPRRLQKIAQSILH